MLVGPCYRICGKSYARHPLYKSSAALQHNQTIDFWGPCAVVSTYGLVLWLGRVKGNVIYKMRIHSWSRNPLCHVSCGRCAMDICYMGYWWIVQSSSLPRLVFVDVIDSHRSAGLQHRTYHPIRRNYIVSTTACMVRNHDGNRWTFALHGLLFVHIVSYLCSNVHSVSALVIFVGDSVVRFDIHFICRESIQDESVVSLCSFNGNIFCFSPSHSALTLYEYKYDLRCV